MPEQARKGVEMIDGNKNTGGAPTAKAFCDMAECKREEVVACGYHRLTSGAAVPDEAQVRKKLGGHGWTYIKGKLRCPKCEAKRKATPQPKKDSPEMKTENITHLRKATPAQKREIVLMLNEVYDTQAGHYRGHDTDKSVADVLEGGVMPGWVAEIRADMFGEDGGNEEMIDFSEKITEIEGRLKKDTHNARVHIEAAEGKLREVNDALSELAVLKKRCEAIAAAVGPKGMRA